VSVLFFGLGYWLVARDPRKNHGLVLIAAAGKTVVGIRWIMAYMAGVAQPFALIGAIGDLVFAGCFAYFLYGASRSKSLLPSV
jgi:cytochrome c biogenesis protein CcdA